MFQWKIFEKMLESNGRLLMVSDVSNDDAAMAVTQAVYGWRRPMRLWQKARTMARMAEKCSKYDQPDWSPVFRIL
jgi:hypothetical protein